MSHDSNQGFPTIADGTIRSLVARPGLVEVEFVDWREKAWTITFTDVISYESISAENTETAELNQEDDPLYLQRIQQLAAGDEDFENQKVFVFRDAWDQRPVLRIVAIDIAATRREPSGLASL